MNTPPVRVTTVPPAVGPATGEIEVNAGLYLNVALPVAAMEAVVSVNVTVADPAAPAGVVTVSVVALA